MYHQLRKAKTETESPKFTETHFLGHVAVAGFLFTIAVEHPYPTQPQLPLH